MQQPRDHFSSQFGVFLAVVGSAVGLGNFWRFPYMVGTHGGAAYIILYLVFVVALCLPIMFSEFIIGRRTQSNVFGAFKKLAPGTGWWGIGLLSVAASIAILSFYCVVGGWTIEYMIQSVVGFSSDVGVLGHNFSSFVESPVRPILWHLLLLGMSAVIVVGGIRNGIEKACKIVMPFLLLMVIFLAIRVLFLPGAGEGVIFLFKPDFSKITAETVLAALGQSFFSLSLGMGCIITYASYVKKEANIVKVSVYTSFADVGFSILCGLAIMPAVFAFGILPSEGPSLAFITLPNIFAQLPFGNAIAFIFFAGLTVAALTSVISLIEVVAAYFTEELKLTRRTAVIITASIIVVTGSLSSLSMGALKGFTIFGKGIFDMFDYLASNILLPLGGLSIVIFVGWVLNKSVVKDELSSEGRHRVPFFKWTMFVIKFIAPIAITIIFLSALGLIKLF
ncbi:MAG: sodium-dependent transporter [Bacteroidales bacterium]|nr:sodium-dependent transporter [Bacteroidales bacterium]MCL2738504.1 sodium-dependent transporter [Bacteroidales bacterium]